jgi:hypothetical protein
VWPNLTDALGMGLTDEDRQRVWERVAGRMRCAAEGHGRTAGVHVSGVATIDALHTRNGARRAPADLVDVTAFVAGGPMVHLTVQRTICRDCGSRRVIDDPVVDGGAFVPWAWDRIAGRAPGCTFERDGRFTIETKEWPWR